MLTIPLERIAAIIVAARESEAEEKASADAARPQSSKRRGAAGNPAPAPAAKRLLELVAGLGAAELNELMALAWMGRGDFEPEAFPEALRQAAKIISTHPAEYVARLPGLADYLRSALTSLGYRVETIREPD